MFKLKDYIFVPKDIVILGRKFWFWSHYTDFLGILALLIYYVVLGRIFSLALEPLFFSGFILAIVYWDMDSRVAISLALLCLVIIPVLQILYNNNILFSGEIWSERIAVWAYYFLVIGVVKQIFELKFNK